VLLTVAGCATAPTPTPEPEPPVAVVPVEKHCIKCGVLLEDWMHSYDAGACNDCRDKMFDGVFIPFSSEQTRVPYNGFHADLKPCPICGSEVIWLVTSQGPYPEYDQWETEISCGNCGLGTTWYNNQQGAIGRWNYRYGEQRGSNPGDIVDSWLVRQKTAILDWMRRVLNLPDPHQPEPPAPPTPDAQPWGVRSEASLWKPVSENDSKVATLFPSSYRRRDHQKHPSDATVDADHAFTGVYLRGPDGDTIESAPRSWSYGNSERWHARWRKPGEDYPDGVQFVLKLESGKLAVFRVNNPSKRESPKARIEE
jgi:DNA-directed RNA polymerase subunit RPC12/RpoP